NPVELQIVAAEWSEHCSYKSSKKHLKILPKEGKRVISGLGYDSGVLDVGDGYVVTIHIESHNHPSAVEPYGGAATGVGGVIRDRAGNGDFVVLIGGSTGRDGIGGAQFASDKIEAENRSAVQIPDPFIEKLLIEAILEARNQNCIKAMKDLGGGGLSCAISETADALSVGIQLDVSLIHKWEENMYPSELMVSESQER